MEQQEPEVEPYESTLLRSKGTIRWKIHNLSDLVKENTWAAMTITFEARGSLGRNYTWRISLSADDDYLYGRAELIAPVKFRILYHIKFHIVGKPEDVAITEENDSNPREIMSQGDPQKWPIIQRKYLKLLKNEEDTIELSVDVNCFGSETSKGFQVQNYPF